MKSNTGVDAFTDVSTSPSLLVFVLLFYDQFKVGLGVQGQESPLLKSRDTGEKAWLSGFVPGALPLVSLIRMSANTDVFLSACINR